MLMQVSYNSKLQKYVSDSHWYKYNTNELSQAITNIYLASMAQLQPTCYMLDKAR